MSRTSPGNAPKIVDVARVAGVSVPTVSRVLNGSTPVSDRLKERVSAAIKELGYRPNSAARALALGSRSMIAILAGNSSRYGWARTIQGIEVTARQRGFSSIVSVVESAEESDVSVAVDLVLAENVAGVIVLEFDEPGRALLRALKTAIPIVGVSGGNHSEGPVPHATLEEFAAGKQVTEYLLSLGHETVHHVSQPTMGRPLGRTDGWQSALEEAGAPVPAIVHCDWEPRTAYRAGQGLATAKDVSAVFCSNDDIAMAVMRAFADNQITVPGDVSVMGFDDQPLAEFWAPSLSTVRQDFDDLGSRAFRLLEALMQGEPAPGNSVAVPKLILRESTNPHYKDRTTL
ncbi:LacI family DNA-binding transcriptional regulator [Paenarthrobacter sp. OM7]|uniref:LacI family DNA-binding transcriptional regulator n=1 Tax=Paenarthrobacter sp. OM7 TaxID=3041264 RepID=UPI0024688E2F|nr:LacI family DNA-binding transcriptional regulator [Paenarthrobacter sp. OM7]WGM20303.1 LacI family DNA-binding transcriptional regulator [Paenarthrobacter sp. OM7]